jgi:molybdopterin-guanine dinucleotide biosynthesis protein MobB
VVAAASAVEAEIIVKGEQSLEDMLRYCSDCDLVLVEGFKKESLFPKIVCLREKEEKEDLFDGLELFTASFKEGVADYLISDDEHVQEMAAVALEKAAEVAH